MNDIYEESFNNQSFNQDCDECTILEINIYKPPDLMFQHVPVKEKVKNNEVKRMKDCHTVDILTIADIQQIVKLGGKVIEIIGGVIYRENFKIFPCKMVFDELFA